MKPRTKTRILAALDLAPLTIADLATMLCENNTTIREAIRTAAKKRLVKPIGVAPRRGHLPGPCAYLWARA